MRISYLDILLSTTTVFVVIFGLSQRGRQLPEMEGTAAVILVSASRPDLFQDDLIVKLIYTHGGTIIEKDSTLNTPPTGQLSDWLSYKFPSKLGSPYLVWLAGQPDPGSKLTIIITGRAKPDQTRDKQLRELELAIEQQEPLGIWEKPLMEWAENGMSLLESSKGEPTERSMAIEEWRTECPWPYISGLKKKFLQSALKGDTPELPSLTVLATAILVHDALSPSNRIMPNLKPNNKQESAVNNAIRLASRRLALQWGEDCAAIPNPPPWNITTPLPERYFPNWIMDTNSTAKVLISKIGFVEAGPFVLRDYKSYTLGVVRMDEVYGGRRRKLVNEWKHKVDGSIEGKLETEFPSLEDAK